jgi:hypothetical protein
MAQTGLGKVVEKASDLRNAADQSSQQQQQQQKQQEHLQPPVPETPALPAAFPKRRRGRPPGRPNATVNEADYADNALVQQWNASRSDRAVPVIAISIREALTEQSLVHDTQRAIFGLPSREFIHYVQGWITPKHIASQRPSYINGLLIHSRGQDAAVSCVQCAAKRAKHALGPFVTCRVLPGSYHNSCSNCKWFDNTASCSLYTGPKPNRKRKAKEELPAPPAADVGPSTGPEMTDQAFHHSSAQYHHNADVSNSESAGAPSRPDSLAEAHFVLARPRADGHAHDTEGDDSESVPASVFRGGVGPHLADRRTASWLPS